MGGRGWIWLSGPVTEALPNNLSPRDRPSAVTLGKGFWVCVPIARASETGTDSSPNFATSHLVPKEWVKDRTFGTFIVFEERSVSEDQTNFDKYTWITKGDLMGTFNAWGNEAAEAYIMKLLGGAEEKKPHPQFPKDPDMMLHRILKELSEVTSKGSQKKRGYRIEAEVADAAAASSIEAALDRESLLNAAEATGGGDGASSDPKSKKPKKSIPKPTKPKTTKEMINLLNDKHLEVKAAIHKMAGHGEGKYRDMAIELLKTWDERIQEFQVQYEKSYFEGSASPDTFDATLKDLAEFDKDISFCAKENK